MTTSSLWQPPLPTSASRLPSLRSRGAYRCTLVTHANNREVVTESRIERNFFVVAAARRDLTSIQEQPPSVTYIDVFGVEREHTFDFLIVRTDGRRIGVDIKPVDRVEATGLPGVHRAIRQQIGDAFADEYVIVTDADVHPDAVADAELILRARRLPDADADEAVRSLMPPSGGWTAVGDLVAASRLGAAGFNAVVRALDEGLLRVRGGARIDYSALVTRAAA